MNSKPTTTAASAIVITSLVFVAIVALAVIASNFAAPAQGMTMEKGNQTGMMSSNMTSGNMTTGNITAGGSSNMTK